MAPAPAPASTAATEPPTGPVEPAAARASAQGGLPPAPAVGGQAIADGLQVQYGGSVTADNFAAFIAQPDIDGALVGGASLKAGDFLAIVQAAQEVTARGKD